MKIKCSYCNEEVDRGKFHYRLGEQYWHPDCFVPAKKNTEDEEYLSRCFPELNWDENVGDC